MEESEELESDSVSGSYISPDFQCDASGGYPTVLVWSRADSTAWLEPTDIFGDESDTYKECLRDCADWGVRRCDSWRDYNGLLYSLGEDAFENALPEYEAEETEQMGGLSL